MTKPLSPVVESWISRVFSNGQSSVDADSLRSSTITSDEQEMLDAALRTKLRRPPVSENVVRRSQLLDRLENANDHPLILLSAPPGYGKTNLLATWLESCDHPNAWLALDEGDNDLPKFLLYFLAALKTMFTDVGQETLEVLSSTPTPTFSELINQLIRELDGIEQDFILVLDDYHVISAPKVHNLIHELLRHPPRNMHLVISGWYDPPLPLSSMRAGNVLTELRIQDLRFTPQETAEFIHRSMGSRVGEKVIEELTARTEGWIGGLHLAALSLDDHGDLDRLVQELRGNHHYVRDYLVEAVLNHQPPSVRECLLKSSILRKLNTEVCDAVSRTHRPFYRRTKSMRGAAFMRWMVESNLFLVPLDDQNTFYRYHRLFQDLLQHQLGQQYTGEQIAKLHLRAGEWFADHGQIEEALHHLFEADATDQVIAVVSQHRYRWMNLEEWEIGDRLLDNLPPSMIHQHLELLMMYAWMTIRKDHDIDLGHLIHEIESLIEDSHQNRVRADLHRGELATLCAIHAQRQGNLGASQEYSRQAISLLPWDQYYLRIQAQTLLSSALLSAGDVEAARDAMADLNRKGSLAEQNSLIMSMAAQCKLHWACNETEQVVRLAKGIIQLGKAQDLNESIAVAHYFLGWIYYFRNELSEAEKNFSAILKTPESINTSLYSYSIWGMALTHHARGHTHQATEVIERGEAYLLMSGATRLLTNLKLLRADLAVREGQISQASQWTSPRDFQFSPAPFEDMVYSSRLSMIKVQMGLRVGIGRERALEWLEQLCADAERMHREPWLIQVLALQSLLYADSGDEDPALAGLERAVMLAEGHGFLRPFLDLGPKMANLLYQLTRRGKVDEFHHNLVNAFMEAKPTMSKLPADELIEPLTERELDVLQLLAMRLINKEIAERLVISPGTVKSHTIRIYRKLDVKGRREAVERAAALGIIPTY